VTDSDGKPLVDEEVRRGLVHSVLAAVRDSMRDSAPDRTQVPPGVR